MSENQCGACAGAKQWDRLVFRVATVTVADAEDIPQPKGDSVEY